MKITIDAALARIQSHLKQAGVPQALLQLRRLHRSIKPRSFTLNQLVIDLARRVQMSDPKSALELIDFVLKSSPNDDAAIVLAIGLCDRTGDQARARSLADKIVRQSQSATPEQKITAANLLVRLLDDPISIETALEAYETLGRPLQWASTVLYIAQRSAHWGAVNQIIKQLNAAYAEGGQLHVTRESPRTHVLWCDDEQINIDVLKYWSSTALKSKTRAIPVAPLGGRKIKLGYLSSDYREHPTSRLVNGLFRHHDRSRFELHMYCSGWDDGSPMRREVESHFDYIHQVTNLSDEKAAELIRSHGIDVLVELNGPTRANRMGILAERAAPVQIDYLGWPGSVGGGPVDYVIGDFYTVPEGAEKLYPERVIRIDQIYQVNDYAARTLPPAPSRASMGLPEDVLVIGMFNAINKVRADVWRVWMEILKAVPNSVLWILDPGKAARKYIGKYTKALGVDPKRIVAAPNLRQEAHLARLQCCDLMLDPWPYGGHTSTSDALFAGVPVVAMKCNNFAGRVSAGLLTAAGLEQLVATDIQQYARIAVHLLCNPGELVKVKAFVKVHSPKRDVFNAARKARQLEQAYSAVLERAARGLTPQHISFRTAKKGKSSATQFKSIAALDFSKYRVAVVTPYYHIEPDKLVRCCASVATQTVHCDHILVADGAPQTLPGEFDLIHLVLPANVGNSGATPRGMGAQYAFAQGYDAVAFLDADNWYESSHIEKAVRVLEAQSLDVVYTRRNIVFEDGEVLKVDDPEDTIGGHVDTNCYVLSKRAAFLASYLALYPKEFGSGEDRYLKKIIDALSLKAALTLDKTVWYESHWASHHRLAGKRPVAPLRKPTHTIGRNWNREIFEQRTGLKATLLAKLMEK